MLPVIVRGAFSDISGYGSLCRYVARALQYAGASPAIYDLRCDRFSKYSPSTVGEEEVLDTLRSRPLPDPAESLVLDVSPPSLFNHCFKADVGYTMTECTRIPARWTMSCLGMDMVMVPGPFNKSVFEKDCGLKVREVAPGFDTDVYRWTPDDVHNVQGDLGPEPFKFVVTGHLMRSARDRKGIRQLIRCWAREFRNDPDVGLALKTQIVGHGIDDRLELTEIVRDILESEGAGEAMKRISVLHRNYSNAELASLYSHPSIRAFVSPTAGEGIGYNMLECASCGGVPVIATDFSEHVNLLPSDIFVPLPCEIVPIDIEHSSVPESPYPEEASWASVGDGVLMEAMRSFYASESGCTRRPVTGEIMPGLSLESFGKRLASEIENTVPGSRFRKDPSKVQVGSGIDPMDGWLHIEENALGSRGVDLACDPKAVPITEGSVCEVAICNLDRMGDEDAARALYGCLRMLRPGGTVHAIVTDCETVMRAIIEREEELSPYAFDYLKRIVTGAGNLWTRRRILKLLSRVGFCGAEVEEGYFYRKTEDDVARNLVGKGFRISMSVRAVKA